MNQSIRWFLGAGALVLSAVPVARADLVISAAPTSNVACGSGACTATASSAVLNVSSLQTMLAAGDVSVSTGSVTSGIDIQAPLTWSSTHFLTLNAKQSITVAALVSVAGTGGLGLLTNDGPVYGSIVYEDAGRIAFSHKASKLSIQGYPFKLAFSIADIASAVSTYVASHIALADNYDAKGDGTYPSSPIPNFGGRFDGLGNAISNLKIVDTTPGAKVGLFGAFVKDCERCGFFEHITVTDVSVTGGAKAQVGGLVGSMNGANLAQASVSGTVAGGVDADVGGLVGKAVSGIYRRYPIILSHSDADVRGSRGAIIGGLAGVGGAVLRSYATGIVTGGQHVTIGGLVGVGNGPISQSFATGSVRAGGYGSYAGGLVGEMALVDRGNVKSPSDSYARGAVTDAGGGAPSSVGGLIGLAHGAAIRTYSTGRITGANTDVKGGFVGTDGTQRVNGFYMSLDYWNLSTSGITSLSAGAGNIANDRGIKGLTRPQFIAGLPVGFGPSVWAQNPSINKGLPYLLANPPAK